MIDKEIITRKLPDCIHCGLCCIAAPCDDNGISCKYLVVNRDLTTTCLNKSAIKAYVGTGCMLRSLEKVIYDDMCETYSLIKTKQSIREDQLKRDAFVKEKL